MRRKLKKKIVVGLTGGIASGKSTVLKEFSKRGAKTLDCDTIAREVVGKGRPALKKISQIFGRKILQRNGSLDRAALAKIVFNNPKKRKILEKIVHPEVIKILNDKISAIKSGLVVVDIPLLFEAGLQKMVDKIIVVWVPLKTQCDRLILKNKIKPQEALRRIRAQWPLDKKKRLSNFVIDNSASLRQAKKQAGQIFEALKS